MVSVLLLFPDASDDLRVDVTIDGRLIETDFGRGLEVRGGQGRGAKNSTPNHRSGEQPIGETISLDQYAINRKGPTTMRLNAGEREMLVKEVRNQGVHSLPL